VPIPSPRAHQTGLCPAARHENSTNCTVVRENSTDRAVLGAPCCFRPRCSSRPAQAIEKRCSSRWALKKATGAHQRGRPAHSGAPSALLAQEPKCVRPVVARVQSGGFDELDHRCTCGACRGPFDFDKLIPGARAQSPAAESNHWRPGPITSARAQSPVADTNHRRPSPTTDGPAQAPVAVSRLGGRA
jgi:hypothetical protein